MEWTIRSFGTVECQKRGCTSHPMTGESKVLLQSHDARTAPIQDRFCKGSVDVQVRDAQVLCVAQAFESGFGSQHNHSSYGNIIIESNRGLSRSDGFSSTNLLSDLACRLQVPTSDKYQCRDTDRGTTSTARSPTPAKVSVLSS